MKIIITFIIIMQSWIVIVIFTLFENMGCEHQYGVWTSIYFYEWGASFKEHWEPMQ